MGLKSPYRLLYLTVLLLCWLQAASVSARSLSVPGQVLKICYFHATTNSLSVVTMSALEWQAGYSKSPWDCCHPADSSQSPCGGSRSCKHMHMTPSCQCIDGYMYNPATHACEGTDAVPTTPARSIKQANPTCPPGCAPSGCVLDSTIGGYKCIFCLGSLLLNTAKGTCDCPTGKYGGDATCADCWKAHYCPGGTYTGPGTPPMIACPSNMTTTGRRSSSIRACVNAAGTSYTVDDAGNIVVTACPQDTYGPGMKKQRACVPCPPGYTTRGATGQITAAACVVPEGYYVKGPGQVAPCPKGEYKSGFGEAASCTKCAAGATTQVVASTHKDNCTILLRSYYADSMDGPAINSTRRCPQSFVCPRGEATAAFDPTNPTAASGTTVLRCPDGTYTENTGASSSSACMTPPGFKTIDGVTSACGEGEYRAEWKPPAAASVCEVCGDGINSTAAEQLALYDPSTGDVSTVAVRASAASCYVKAGQGMYFSAATNTYYAVNCDSNSYGVSDLTYGLAAHPCRDCPAGMQTSADLPNSASYFVSHGGGVQGFTSPMACVTQAGYGYDGRVANRCPAGFFNAAGNYNTCQQCQTGLSTPNNASKQVSEADCTLAVGYGFHDNTIVPCPLGTYRDALAASTTSPCLSCPAHVTTSQAGGVSTDDCNTCAVGYGGQACATVCGGDTATFGPAARALHADCEGCPVTKPGYFFDYNGVNQPFAPATVSRLTAASLGDCLAEFAQIEDNAWFLGGAVAMTTTAAATFEDCVDGCKADANCMYLTFNYANSQCHKKLAAETSGGDVLAFKALLAADTTFAKTNHIAAANGLASGAYTFWWQSAAGIGASTTPVVTASFQACLTACDVSPTCAAVAITGVTTSKAPIQSCNLIKGDTTVATFRRSLTKVNTSRLVLPANPADVALSANACGPYGGQRPAFRCSSYTIDTIAGGGQTRVNDYSVGVPAKSAKLVNLGGIHVDQETGDLYMTAPYDRTVSRLEAATGLIRLIGGVFEPGNPPAGDWSVYNPVPGTHPAYTTRMYQPIGVHYRNGEVFVVEEGNHIVRKINLATKMLHEVAGNKNGVEVEGSIATNFAIGVPGWDMAFDEAGNMFVTGWERSIYQLNATTQTMTTAFTGNAMCPASAVACTNVPGGFGPFSRSTCGDFAFSDRDRNIKMYKHATKSFDNVYSVTHTMGAKLMWDLNGYDVWVGDTNRIARLQDGQLVTIAGQQLNASSTGDGGPATAATLRTTWAMTQDAAGSVYFVDAITYPNDMIIRKLTCMGVTAVAP